MTQETTNASLSPGTLIGRYEIREVLGVGGFGITYKANDTKLKRLVAIKEYLPAETAVRVQGSSQINAYESRADEYQYGLERFLDEAKTLAKFHHPNIIGVLDHIELNNTAYLIMTYEQGQTLSQQLKQQGGKLPEQELKATVKALLNGLQHIHEQDYYHRDIKPGNIYIRKQGEPVLIDFGAARQAISARSRSLTNIVSAGYAPNEQYGSNQSKQGPWSDLYAMGATMYRSVSGQEPTDAPTRSSEIMEGDPDPLVPAQTIGQGHYTENLLQLIDWMLAPAIKNRPQNVAQVIARLENTTIKHEAISTAPTITPEESHSTAPTKLLNNNESIEISDIKAETLSDRYKPTTVVEIPETSKSKGKVILISLSLFTLAIIGISQKHTLQQWMAGKSNQPEFTQTQIQPPKAEKIQTSQIEAAVDIRVKEALKKKAEETQLAQKQEEIGYQQQRQEKIQTTLTNAATDIKQLRLSSPKGNNAVEKYKQVLQWESDNPQAQQGLTNITEKYLQLANNSLKKQQYEKARQYLAKAKIVQTDNPKIETAESTLKQAEENHQQEKARLAEEEKAEENRFNIAMIKVNSGCFQMGNNEGGSDETPHRVCSTQAYDLGKYEVTQAQWQKVMGDNPSRFKGRNKPVESVSWDNVQSFIRKLNQQTGQGYRLPTEAEWEYACRSGGRDQTYCGGNNANSVGWYNNNSGGTTHNVGQKKANGLGFYDMSGNVREWVQDRYGSDYYSNSPTNNPTGASGGSVRVYRGGSWSSIASFLRSAFRFGSSPGSSYDYLGFRLARTR